MAPPIPDGHCPHCQVPDGGLFAEWTAEYQTPAGKQAIMAGEVVFDCYFCGQPFQLVLPLDIILPRKPSGASRVARRQKFRCQEWLRSQHPGEALSDVVAKLGLDYSGRWAFDGYN